MEHTTYPRERGSSGRAHIVLVPGFAGFDAMGQINYYAGTSAVYSKWVEQQAPGALGTRSVLHYFDNLPSGAVSTRADKLHGYLAKRVARNVFQADDRIVLVGHSTGGLDIRHLLMDLRKPGARIVDDANKVDNARLLSMIRRVVFLSTPHYGSNIADEYFGSTALVTLALRAAFLGLRASLFIPRSLLARLLGPKPELDPWYAIQDTVFESHDRGLKDPVKAADAREAFSQVALWLNQMASDFNVLKDLRTSTNADKAEEPWPSDILARSYATVAPAPIASKLSVPERLKHWLTRNPDARAKQDWVYRLSYRMTSTGALQRPPGAIKEAWFVPTQFDGVLDNSTNDGIVNTASMFWKHGGETRLVLADHGDIIGHFRRDPGVYPKHPGLGRRFKSYDFFKSNSGFDGELFEAIWRDIFAFGAGSLDVSKPRPDAGYSASEVSG